MEILKKNKYIIIGVTLLFIGFIAYNNFLKKEKENGIKDTIVAETDTDTLDMLNVLDKIKNIEINPDFFNQKPDEKGYGLVFSQLDPSEPVPNEKPAGKINPFILGGATAYQDVTSTDETDNESGSADNNSEVKQVIIPANNS